MSDTSNRPLWPILLAGVVFVVVTHLIAGTVAFTAASGWDSACQILYSEQGDDRDWYGAHGPQFSFYTDPGYTCDYLVDDTTVTLRKDLTGARNVTWAMTLAATVVAAAGVALFRRWQSNPGTIPG